MERPLLSDAEETGAYRGGPQRQYAMRGPCQRCARWGSPDRWRQGIRKNALILATLAAVVLGVVLGFALRTRELDYDATAWIAIWGELFLRMLKLIILPLVMSCLVVGVGSVEGSVSGRLGVVLLLYIFLTQFVAVILGVALVFAIRPGAGFGDSPPEGATGMHTSYTDVFTDLMRNMVPDNIIRAFIQTTLTTVQTELVEPGKNSTLLLLNSTNVTSLPVLTRQLVYRDGINTLGVVIISLVMGVAISAAGPRGKPLFILFQSLNDVIFIIMKVIIWYSPLGILSLIASAIINVDDMETALTSLGYFVMTSVVGCLAHQLVLLPLMYLVIVRKNPFKFMLGLLDAILAGMAPPSSAAALPFLMSDCIEKLHIDQRVASFALPICVTINRDGSALFIAVAAVFCAQTYGIALGVGQVVALCLLVTVMVAATAAVPSSSIVVLLMVSGGLGIPVEARLGLLMAVEWLLDRVRSATNITSHGFSCAIVQHFCRDALAVSPSSGGHGDEDWDDDFPNKEDGETTNHDRAEVSVGAPSEKDPLATSAL